MWCERFEDIQTSKFFSLYTYHPILLSSIISTTASNTLIYSDRPFLIFIIRFTQSRSRAEFDQAKSWFFKFPKHSLNKNRRKVFFFQKLVNPIKGLDKGNVRVVGKWKWTITSRYLIWWTQNTCKKLFISQSIQSLSFRYTINCISDGIDFATLFFNNCWSFSIVVRKETISCYLLFNLLIGE